MGGSDDAETPETPDDSTLVAALRHRDPAAMRALYERYSDRIFGFLYRLTRDRALADDLHQETWLAAARHAVNLRPESDLAAWLFTIARNKYRSWCRWSVLAEPFGHPLKEQEHAGSENPQGGFQNGFQDDLRDLEQALARLAPPFREVLLLVGCEGLQATQVARILGITPEAVRQRVARARAALWQEISPDNLADARMKLKGTR